MPFGSCVNFLCVAFLGHLLSRAVCPAPLTFHSIWPEFPLQLFYQSAWELESAIPAATPACRRPPNDTPESELINTANVLGSLVFRDMGSVFSLATELLRSLYPWDHAASAPSRDTTKTI